MRTIFTIMTTFEIYFSYITNLQNKTEDDKNLFKIKI